MSNLSDRLVDGSMPTTVVNEQLKQKGKKHRRTNGKAGKQAPKLQSLTLPGNRDLELEAAGGRPRRRPARPQPASGPPARGRPDNMAALPVTAFGWACVQRWSQLQ